LKKLLDEVTAEKYEHSGDLKKLEGQVNDKFANLESTAEKKKKTLEGDLEKQKKINDDLCKAFAEDVKKFTEWVSSRTHQLANKDAKLEDLLAFVEKTLGSASEVEGLLTKVDEANSKVVARQIPSNPYTNVTAEDCKAQWSQFQLMLNKKKELVVQEIENAKRSGLTEEQVREVNANFDYFDKDKTGVLERRELRACLQSLGEEATPVGIQQVLDTYDTSKKGVLSKAAFTEFMYKKLGDSNTKNEILQGFSYLSLEKETIPVELLESVVNELTFKQHHVDYLKKELKGTPAAYDFKTWTEEVFAR